MRIMFKSSSIKLSKFSSSNHEKLIIVAMVWSLLISYLPVQSEKICDQTFPIGKYKVLFLVYKFFHTNVHV